MIIIEIESRINKKYRQTADEIEWVVTTMRNRLLKPIKTIQ